MDTTPVIEHYLHPIPEHRDPHAEHVLCPRCGQLIPDETIVAARQQRQQDAQHWAAMQTDGWLHGAETLMHPDAS